MAEQIQGWLCSSLLLWDIRGQMAQAQGCQHRGEKDPLSRHIWPARELCPRLPLLSPALSIWWLVSSWVWVHMAFCGSMTTPLSPISPCFSCIFEKTKLSKFKYQIGFDRPFMN